jgi:hypothetical protein
VATDAAGDVVEAGLGVGLEHAAANGHRGSDGEDQTRRSSVEHEASRRSWTCEPTIHQALLSSSSAAASWASSAAALASSVEPCGEIDSSRVPLGAAMFL